jgi:hypothetical protein
MPSIISTKTSGGGGIAVTGDTSGVLQLQSANGTTAVTIDASQNVGIGTSSPSTGTLNRQLTINSGASGLAGVLLQNNATGTSFNNGTYFAIINGTDASITNQQAGYLQFGTNNTERMRIGSNGNLFIGTTTNPVSNAEAIINAVVSSGDGFNLKHTVNGNNMFNLWQTGTTTYTALAFNKGDTQTLRGQITVSTSSVAYNTTSDYRLKENVLPMTGALDTVAQLKPVTYNWKENGSNGQGFIAHELQEVVPDCVTGEKDAVDAEGNPQYQGIDTSFLVATLTAAIQEQQAIITDLKARIEVLEGASV